MVKGLLGKPEGGRFEVGCIREGWDGHTLSPRRGYRGGPKQISIDTQKVRENTVADLQLR